MKHNWYYRGSSKFWEFFSILHIPYTSMVLAYVTIGSVLAPTFDLGLLGLLLVAYFLGLGIAAHAADQLSTTGTRYVRLLTKRELESLLYGSLTGAVAIGAYMIWHYSLSPWFVPFVALNVFFAFAYPRGDWFGGRFHNDVWFSISWGALPFFTAYIVNSLIVTPHVVLIALILTITSGIEITLSRWARDLRKPSAGFLSASGFAEASAELRKKPELALKLLVLEVDLLAVALLLWRLGA